MGDLKIKNWLLLARWWWKFEEKNKPCGGTLLVKNMVRMIEVGLLVVSLGIRCQVYGGNVLKIGDVSS